DRLFSHHDKTSVFQNMATGFAYLLAQQRLAHDPRWSRVRRTVEAFMRRQILIRLNPFVSHFGNHLLVESLEVFTFFRSGVTSGQGTAVLGPHRGALNGMTKRFIRTTVPHFFASSVVRSGGD